MKRSMEDSQKGLKKWIVFYFIALIIGLISFTFWLIGCSFAEPSGNGDAYYFTVNTTALHAINHENSGIDEMNLVGLSGLLADDQHVLDSEAISAIENASPLTLPAFTLGGTLTWNSQDVNVGTNRINILSAAGDGFRVQSKRTDTLPATIVLWADSTSPANNDYIGTVDFYGENSDSTYSFFASLRTQIIEKAAGSETGRVHILVRHNGGYLFPFIINGDSVIVDGYVGLPTINAPSAGGSDTARIYAFKDISDNLTDLCAVYQDGTVDIFSQETTELTSPLFTMPSGTTVVNKIVKPHAGLIQFISVYSTGEFIITRQIEYHDYDKINANKGCEGELPEGWLVETAEQRAIRNLIPVLPVISGNITGSK